jgi:hypothetical protein
MSRMLNKVFVRSGQSKTMVLGIASMCCFQIRGLWIVIVWLFLD